MRSALTESTADEWMAQVMVAVCVAFTNCQPRSRQVFSLYGSPRGCPEHVVCLHSLGVEAVFIKHLLLSLHAGTLLSSRRLAWPSWVSNLGLSPPWTCIHLIAYQCDVSESTTATAVVKQPSNGILVTGQL